MTDIAGFSTLEYLAHINASFSNEKLCEWTQNQRIEYKTLLDALEQSNGTNSCATKEEKGRSLEEIASYYNKFGQESRTASPAFPPSRA